MFSRIILGVAVMMCFMVNSGNAGGKEGIQKYFNDTAGKVKATAEPAQKRAILQDALQTMSTALDKVQNSRLISKTDRASLAGFKATLQEKQDELAGNNGYERVADAQLNAFSHYIVQDMEQASKTITITTLTAILVGVIVILLVAV